MEHDPLDIPAEVTAPKSRWRRTAPVITLLLLAPFISEVLSGSTRITTLFVLIPATGVWGCAALIIREVVRRRGGSIYAMVLLGLALAVAEECVIQQTSLAPLVAMDPAHIYGRFLGVNWVYFIWALGFECLWAVVIPIMTAELLFPTNRKKPWIGRKGLVISAVIFGAASFAAWYSWTQVYVPKFFPQSVYHVPPLVMAGAVGVVVLLIAIAMALPAGATSVSSSGSPPKPWVAGVTAFVLALPWYLLVLLAFGALPDLPVAIPIAIACIIAAVAAWLARTWASQAEWQERHRLAVIAGVVTATMIGGALGLSAAGALLIDRIGQVAFCGGMLLLLGELCRQRRT